MYNATEIFTPTDFPIHTYVVRGEDRLEDKLRDALEVPKQPISISGPSKSGKTALVVKVVGQENLIKVSGIEIRSPGDLWECVLDWMDSPSITTSGSTDTVTDGTRYANQVPLPKSASFLAERSKLKSMADNAMETRARRGLPQVCKEIAGSDFVVFLDDFHYMPSEVQSDVAREIKTAAERNIKICIASVPHRSDDVVRSNHELRGRTVNIDTKFWSVEELFQIGSIGFPKMNIRIKPEHLREFAQQSCGSPQLMQSICLDVCRSFDVRLTHLGVIEVEITSTKLKNILEDTATRANFSSLIRDLHQGPRSQGKGRDKFLLVDGTNGDSYRCVLLSLKRDPPRFEIGYAELLERVRAACIGNGPTGQSIQNACTQITKIAVKNSPTQRIVEWDERAGAGTFSIGDPYFLFYIRHSNKLEELGRS